MSDHAPTHSRNHARTLKFIPLGGVGTFGMNSAVLQWGESFMLIDASRTTAILR